jgi:hypothetical protein
LLIGACWPIVLVLAAAAGSIVVELIRERRTDPELVAPRGRRAAVQAGLQRTLPMMLVLTFVLVPSTATLIFKSFLCDTLSFANTGTNTETRRYLQMDLHVQCDTDDYAATLNIAYVMIAVWPLGVPLLYGALLVAARDALVTGTPTPLSRAIAFLSEDYEAIGHGTLWWEPVEMIRKLVLTGEGRKRLLRVTLRRPSMAGKPVAHFHAHASSCTFDSSSSCNLVRRLGAADPGRSTGSCSRGSVGQRGLSCGATRREALQAVRITPLHLS